MRNFIIFNGKSFMDYGVYISGDGTFNAPERDTTKIEIPGRNGTLTVDKGRYKNLPVKYPAFIVHDFNANIEAGNDKQIQIRDLVESYHLHVGPSATPGNICAVSTLENIFDKYGYDVLDRTLLLCIGTWEGAKQSLSANMLNAVARLIYVYGDTLSNERFKEKVGRVSAKEISRTAIYMKMRSDIGMVTGSVSGGYWGIHTLIIGVS